MPRSNALDYYSKKIFIGSVKKLFLIGKKLFFCFDKMKELSFYQFLRKDHLQLGATTLSKTTLSIRALRIMDFAQRHSALLYHAVIFHFLISNK